MDLTHVGAHTFYAFLLVLARVGGLVVAAPLLSNKAIPRTVKAGLIFIFSLSITPLVQAKVGPVPEHYLILVGRILADSLFGLSLGFLGRVLFLSMEMAGYLADTQMGFGFVNLVNPFTEQQSSALSSFQYQLALTMFLMANGHLLMLGTILESYRTVAPGGFVPTAAFGLSVIPTLQSMFLLGIKMALPAVGVLAVLDVALGLVARSVPQMNVFIVGLPAKVIVGMMTLIFLLPVISSIVGQIILNMAMGMNSLIEGAH